ncbi:unnamed protein product [Porites lobata]|uniref:MULE transposase domain-containing protein n=1 Tax=Porites lobata TaxID=104759 RepID=A0ABN8NLA5_9CNID|nr:unnamed protein product [Porites lobata]
MEVGDIANCNSVGALPRNERQAKYLKEKNSKGRIADPIFEITEKMKTEDKKFTRGYSLDDESPKVILFMDEQVEDIATYLTLFQKISAQVPGLQVNLKGYCTDSEEALRQALAQVFPNSASLLCKVHAQKNIEEKCRKLRFSQSLTNEIVHDIFGSGGLVYADSYEEYNQKLNSLTEKWDRKEFKDSPEELAFSKYFRRYKAEEIWNHVTAKASKMRVLRTKYKPTTFQSQQMLFSNDGKTSKPQTWPVLSRIVGASSPNSDVMFNGHCWGFQARIY